MSGRRLSTLQSWFARAITTPESGFAVVAREAKSYLTPAPNGSEADRLLVYVRDYWARCLDSLQEDFPGAAHLLGHRTFRSWMERYVVAWPSRSYTLRDLGRRLLDFMRRQYSGKDKERVLDMIRFEWAQIEAFDRGHRAAFDPADLTARQKSRLPRTRLVFQPHVSLLKLAYPVYDIVDRLKVRDSKNRIPAPPRNTCYTVVYRRDGIVFHREIERPFYLLLSELQKGMTLAGACDAVRRKLSRRDLTRLEQNAQAWFQVCVANHWLCALKGEKTNGHDPALFSVGDEFSVQNRVVAAAPRPTRHRIRLFPQRKRKTARPQ